jgi:hypothetical protein
MDSKEVKEVKKRKPRVRKEKKPTKKTPTKRGRKPKTFKPPVTAGLLGDLGLLTPLKQEIKKGIANLPYLGMGQPQQVVSPFLSKSPYGFTGLYGREIRVEAPKNKGTIETLKDELNLFKKELKENKITEVSPQESEFKISEIKKKLSSTFRNFNKTQILKYLNRYIGIFDDTNEKSLSQILDNYKSKTSLIDALSGYFEVGMYGLEWERFLGYIFNNKPKNFLDEEEESKEETFINPDEIQPKRVDVNLNILSSPSFSLETVEDEE